MSFDIKPLNWINDVASTPFGYYEVGENATGFYWKYDFGYPDEDQFECDSVEEGRHAAWMHWVDRLTIALKSVEGS